MTEKKQTKYMNVIALGFLATTILRRINAISRGEQFIVSLTFLLEQ
jgi:hypothetical protein